MIRWRVTGPPSNTLTSTIPDQQCKNSNITDKINQLKYVISDDKPDQVYYYKQGGNDEQDP